MPKVSRFFGTTIRFYFNDHEPAHFHATYGEYEAAHKKAAAVWRVAGRTPEELPPPAFDGGLAAQPSLHHCHQARRIAAAQSSRQPPSPARNGPRLSFLLLLTRVDEWRVIQFFFTCIHQPVRFCCG